MSTRLARLAQFQVAALSAGRLRAAVIEVLFGSGCTGAFIIARLAVDAVAPTAGPYALIYPVTLVATLFGTWLAGAVTYVSTFLWTWYFVRTHNDPLHLVRPIDAPRTLVNCLSVFVLLLLAELFRNAVHRAVTERESAIRELKIREIALHELNDDLEGRIAARIRELGQTWAVSPDLLGVLNIHGYFESTNPAWQTNLGWPADKLRSTKFVEFVHPDDLDATYAAWDRIREGDPVLHFENRYKTSRGTWRWLSWIVVPEGDKFYGSARDITDEKERQANLAATQDALRQSQKLDALGQLTGGVAHDFNNLLTVIIGSVGMLRKENLSLEQRNRYIDAISSTADRASKLTSQLLTFARQQSLDPIIFNVCDSLEDIQGIIQTLSGARIDVVKSFHGGRDYYVVADKAQFDTAIINMSINARDAMSGEGRLTMSVNHIPSISPDKSHYTIAGGFVAVSIEDTGSGIDPDVADRIFEPFFTTKPIGAGTGLGLSQVFGFARQSGGDIRVSSVKGAGSTFTLYLPRAAADGAVKCAQ